MTFEKIFNMPEVIVPLSDCSGCGGCDTADHSTNKFSKTGGDARKNDNKGSASHCTCS